MKIPFDIKFRPQIESGEYKVVIEYDNRTFYARIVCWDFNSTELIACVNYGDREDALEYDSSGKHIGKSVRRPDLIIITPEPELSEFEKKFQKIISDWQGDSSPFEDNMSYLLHKDAAELLELAKKELCESGEVTDWYAKGRKEALKDLPRWKKHEEASDKLAMVWNDFATPWLDWRGHRIAVRDLEKLPGFNE